MRGAKIAGQPDSEGTVISLLADGLSVEGSVLLRDDFKANGEVRLNGCSVARNLDCTAAKLSNRPGYSLSAAGARIAGTAYLCRADAVPSSDTPQSSDRAEAVMQDTDTPRGSDRGLFSSEGTVRFDGARIDGDLDCRGGRFIAEAFLSGAGDDLYAIQANSLIVGGDLMFGDRFHARGVTSFIGARVGGDFNCEDAFFDFPGEEPLYADGITVSGTTFLTQGAKTNGILRFVLANFRQGFYVDGATFDASQECQGRLPAKDEPLRFQLEGPASGIYAPSAEVAGGFRWLNINKVPDLNYGKTQLWLHLSGGKADSVEDDRKSWEALDRFDVTDCIYGSVSNLSSDVRWRIAQLDRQYAILNPILSVSTPSRLLAYATYYITHVFVAMRVLWRARPWRDRSLRDTVGDAAARFAPQPYIELAKAVRDAGFEAASRTVAVSLERNKTRYSELSMRTQLGRWILDLGLRYGFSPFRPVWILVIWAFVSAGLFEIAFHDGAIVPTKDNLETPSLVAAVGAPSDQQQTKARSVSGTTDHPRVTFNALIYAIDTLVPLVDLNQKKNWVVEPLSKWSAAQGSGAPNGWLDAVHWAWRDRPDCGAGFLIVFNTFFGWMLTTFLGVMHLTYRTPTDSTHATGRRKRTETEIEITQEMVEAGADVLSGELGGAVTSHWFPEALAREVYQAMAALSLGGYPSSRRRTLKAK